MTAESERRQERRQERRRESRRAAARRRRILGVVAGAALVTGVATAALSTSGHGSRRPVRAAHTKPRAATPVVDRVLAYTDYVLAGSPRRREVALTFDDGPGPYTPKVLRILHRAHAPATFFPVGAPITAFGPTLDQVVRAGHPVGDHTMTHPLIGHLPSAIQAREIDGQARLLTRRRLPYPRLFRPPNGNFDFETRRLLARRGMLMVLWSVNPEDYFRPGAAQIAARVTRGLKPGAIVLLHDGGGDRSQTVRALPAILRALRRRHLEPVTIPRLLEDDPPPRNQPEAPPNLSGV